MTSWAQFRIAASLGAVFLLLSLHVASASADTRATMPLVIDQASAMTMALDITVQLAEGKPAPDGAVITAFALPSQETSNHATSSPPACSSPTKVIQSRAALVVDGACATQYASETAGTGILGFGITFTNQHGQPSGAGSLTRVNFAPGDVPSAVTVVFDIDPSVPAVLAGQAAPTGDDSAAPAPPATGTGPMYDSSHWWLPLLTGLVFLSAAACILRWLQQNRRGI
jgi:hypothetical protein